MPRKSKGGKEGKDSKPEEKAPKEKITLTDEALQSLIPMMQQRLGGVVGKSSGYFESLPKPVQDRVRALKKLQSQQGDLDKQYKKELLQLEAKFRDLAKPLFEKRRDIITGSYEPKPEEMEEEKPKEGEEAKVDETKQETKKDVKPEDVKGIPGFWLEALKHHDDFSDLVQEGDEECLKHLIDIKCHPIENEETPTPSFVLEFHFTPNEWFEETLLIKTYHLFEDTAYGEVMYDHVDCPNITWKAGKNLCMKEVTKQVKVGGKPRGGKGGRGRDRGGKGAQQTKTITVQEPVPSFFQFFNLNLEHEEIESEEQIQDILEADYEMGLAIKQQLIPNAVMWYTGEAENIGMGGFMGGEDDDDGDLDGEEDDEEDNEYEAPTGAAPQPECKQQ